MRTRTMRITLAAALVVILIAGVVAAVGSLRAVNRTHIVAYFDNSNGVFTGDEVRILGVPVGSIDKIEPQPNQVKVSFWVDAKYKVPADAQAAIISPTLITSRAIQLVPAYGGGPRIADGAVIPKDRTVVPIEWDDVRVQLAKLTDALQPTKRGGVSTLGAFVNTAADNLRGNGASIRDTLVKTSQALSVLGDHSDDIFSTVKNLSVLVSALHDSRDLLAQLNTNLDVVSGLLANDPNEIADAVRDLNAAVKDVQHFARENKESLGVTFDKLSSISNAVVASLDDLKQTLHVSPNAFQNFVNIYQPAQSATTGQLALNNFTNPIQFVCGAIQAASRMGGEQSAKLCAQYLAPIVKNRQYSFLPFGINPIVGTDARPNEVTYSEDWMRPDHVPPAPAADPPADAVPVSPSEDAPLAAEAPTPTDPAAGLPGLMVPQGGG